jgi:hypothetical protein
MLINKLMTCKAQVLEPDHAIPRWQCVLVQHQFFKPGDCFKPTLVAQLTAALNTHTKSMIPSRGFKLLK